jgi:hypothetical protein
VTPLYCYNRSIIIIIIAVAAAAAAAADLTTIPNRTDNVSLFEDTFAVVN